MLEAGTGRSCQFRSRSSFKPWKSPASTMTGVPLDSTRYFEPVTVRAAPRNVIEIICLLPSTFCLLPFAFCLLPFPLSGEESDLTACVPEECRARAELAGPRFRDEPGHRFCGIRRIEKQRLSPGAELDRFRRLGCRDPVAPADEPVFDRDRRAGEGPSRRAEQLLEAAQDPADLPCECG